MNWETVIKIQNKQGIFLDFKTKVDGESLSVDLPCSLLICEEVSMPPKDSHSRINKFHIFIIYVTIYNEYSPDSYVVYWKFQNYNSDTKHRRYYI